MWQAQVVGDVDPFSAEFKCRVKDVSKQDWYSDTCNNPKVDTYIYVKLKLELCVEKYLLIDMWKRHRVALYA